MIKKVWKIASPWMKISPAATIMSKRKMMSRRMTRKTRRRKITKRVSKTPSRIPPTLLRKKILLRTPKIMGTLPRMGRSTW